MDLAVRPHVEDSFGTCPAEAVLLIGMLNFSFDFNHGQERFR